MRAAPGKREMALRNIVMDGDPILNKKCRPVVKFDDRLARLLDDMGETMLENDGMGLAGPQVGILRRLFVALGEDDLPARGEEAVDGEATGEGEDRPPVPLEFINPEIVEREGEARAYEGCLSFPGRFGAVARPQRVKVHAQDRDGNPFEYEAEGVMARCLCHEIDHLNGVTIDELAEYFYDPEQPHDLDRTLYGDDENDSPPGAPESSGSASARPAPRAGGRK
jgi:peptide deformylase